MIAVSLLLNVAVLVPVTIAMCRRATWTLNAYGERTPAHDILLAIYMAILGSSIALLIAATIWPTSDAVNGAVCALLGVQIAYKALTLVTVNRSLRNPVVVSNLAIAIVHVATVALTVPMLLG